MKTLLGFHGLILPSSLLIGIVWSQTRKYLTQHREKKEITKRFQQLKAEKKQRELLILFFAHGHHSEWGKKNRDEINCLNTGMQHLAQSIFDNMDSDLFQISILEKDVIRIRDMIHILKESGAL